MSIKALGEIALRVNNLERMVEFYQSTLGLNLMRLEKQFAFFKISEGFQGHTQVLALFDRNVNSEDVHRPDSRTTTIDHIAFTISAADFDSENERLLQMGHEISYAYHDWVKWRSLYLNDPEGNTIELVCYEEEPPKPST